jgi:hypothetical protein
MRPALLLMAAASSLGCRSSVGAAQWTCDYDASEARPLSNPDAAVDEAGALPATDCQNTCGPPVSTCTWTLLDGGRPGAMCPVCTF